MYSDKVIEHFMSPYNVGTMPQADGIGEIGDPDCGDHCQMFIKVQQDCIQEISFLIFGCAAAVACGSMTTVLAKGKSIQDALRIMEQDVVDALEGLPEAKQHCSNLGVAALRKAIENYFFKQETQQEKHG